MQDTQNLEWRLTGTTNWLRARYLPVKPLGKDGRLATGSE